MDYADVVARLQPKIMAIAAREARTGLGDRDDLYQEALLHLWLKWRARGLDGKTDSYILQGCMFHMKNCIRMLERDRCGRFAAVLRPPSPRPESGALPRANDLLGLLDGRERKVVDMLAAGFTSRETGREIGVSHVMVCKILRRARRKCALAAAPS